MNENKMKQLRLDAGVNINDAVNNLSISYSMLTKIERHDRYPSTKLILRMSKLYNCSIDKIYQAMQNN